MRLTSAVLIIVSLSACTPPAQTIEIVFEARLGEQKIDCETVIDGVSMSDLRFFVTDPVLNFADSGTDVNVGRVVDFGENGRWQQDGLVLIDLENGGGACVNGTTGTNSVLIGSVPAGDYRGLFFRVEVPFDQNHADPLAASPPLDDSTMHWHWRSGYKFLRAGLQTDDDGFWMHVGSAGCEGTVQNITGCSYPNRMAVGLPDYAPGDIVVFDFEPLLGAVDVSDGAPTDCSSGPAEEECREPFRAYGLDFGSGLPGTNSQLFRVESR